MADVPGELYGNAPTSGGTGEDPNDKYPMASGPDFAKPADPWGEKQLPLQQEGLPARLNGGG